MRLNKCIPFLLVISLFSLNPCSIYGDTSILWAEDFQSALNTSKIEKKNLLLFFNGSDWSVDGMKLKNEIFESSSFQNHIHEELTFVEIDFPHHSALNKEIERQNLDLKQRFKIEELPLVLLLDSDEREIARLGYLPENGVQFAEDLLHIVKMDRTLIDRLSRLASCSTEELKELYQIALELQRKDLFEPILKAGINCDDPSFFLLERYRLLVNAGEMKNQEALDLKNQLLKNSSPDIHFSVALVDFQGLSKNALITDPKRIVAPLVDYLEKFGGNDTKNVWQIEMMIAQVYLDYDEWQAALNHAEIAFLSAPNNVKEEIEHSVHYIRHQAGQIANR